MICLSESEPQPCPPLPPAVPRAFKLDTVTLAAAAVAAGTRLLRRGSGGSVRGAVGRSYSPAHNACCAENIIARHAQFIISLSTVTQQALGCINPSGLVELALSRVQPIEMLKNDAPRFAADALFACNIRSFPQAPRSCSTKARICSRHGKLGTNEAACTEQRAFFFRRTDPRNRED